MKEAILLFVGEYADNEVIPDLKEKVQEYLGKRMIKDNCPSSPMLKLDKELETADVTSICQIINGTSGSSLSALYIKVDNENELGVLSNVFVGLTPVV